jgi:hypothetical protein
MVMVVERGDAAGACTGKVYQQEVLCFLRDRYVLTGVNCLKNSLQVIFWKCIQVSQSETYSDRKSQKTMVKANCIPVHCYNQKGAWIYMDIFENWFHKHFFPEVWPFSERERITTESSVAARQCHFSSKMEHANF